MIQVFEQHRALPRQPVLSENLSRALLRLFKPCPAFLSEIRLSKTLSTNLSGFSAWKPVFEPVFCRNVVVAKLVVLFIIL